MKYTLFIKWGRVSGREFGLDISPEIYTRQWCSQYFRRRWD